MADMFPVYDSIRRHLKTSVEAQGAGFVDGYVAEGDDAPRDSDGTLRPFVTLDMGDATPHRYGQGICGPQRNLEQLDFLVICSADAYQFTIGLVDVVTRALVGFRPTADTGLIERIGGTINAPVGALLHPIRYNKGVSFWVPIGAQVNA